MKNKIKLLYFIPALTGFLALSACGEPEQYSPLRLNSATLIDIYNNEADTIEDSPLEKITMEYTYQDLIDNYIYNADNIPSNGNPKMLIIPVWFSDSGKFIPFQYRENIRSDIYKAFFGNENETGWRSVAGYYKQESMNKLTISGSVSGWYDCNKSYSDFPETTDTLSLLKNAVNWFKSQNSDLSNFDSDNDGYIDSVCLIYAGPDYYNVKSKPRADLPLPVNTNMWAYSYWLQEKPDKKNPLLPNSFLWASYDFMYDRERQPANKGNYGYGDCSHLILDTHTYIHETGHLLGLQDYYDYAGSVNPVASYEAAGCFSMQDNNVGGHDPYSKLALGWERPYVIDNNLEDESVTLTIRPNQETGDVIMITPEFSGSPFDEYILIELYTPSGLNYFDSKYEYQHNSTYKGATIPGCRIWHVDARLGAPKRKEIDGEYQYYYSDASSITTNPKTKSQYGLEHATTNTTVLPFGGTEGYCTKVPGFEDYRLLQLIRRDKKYMKCGDSFTNTDLFITNTNFNMNLYANCFANKGKLNNKSRLNFTVHFDEVTQEKATITISKI